MRVPTWHPHPNALHATSLDICQYVKRPDGPSIVRETHFIDAQKSEASGRSPEMPVETMTLAMSMWLEIVSESWQCHEHTR